MHSAIYRGRLRHRRFAPRAHEFSYRLFMLYVDLAELDRVFHGRWLWSVRRPALAWLRRRDYLGDPTVSIDQAVRDRVQAETGVRPTGPIRMLTHLRYFGIGFNPVTFYYCYDAENSQVETVLAEITNTPWMERHVYVLRRDAADRSASAPMRVGFRKTFHVSPFMPMSIDYDWRLSHPSERLTVHMQNLHDRRKVFDATLDLQRRDITPWTLAQTLIAYPLMTATVVVGIYWQAFRLWFKRVPHYTHPSKSTDHEHLARSSSAS